MLALCTVSHAKILTPPGEEGQGCGQVGPVGKDGGNFASPVGKDGGNNAGPVGKDGGNLMDWECLVEGKDSGNGRGDGRNGEVNLNTCIEFYNDFNEVVNHESPLFEYWSDTLNTLADDDRTAHLFHLIQKLGTQTTVCITENFEKIERQSVGPELVDEFRFAQWKRTGQGRYHIDVRAEWAFGANARIFQTPMAKDNREVMKGLLVELLHPWFPGGKQGEIFHHQFVEALVDTNNTDKLVEIMNTEVYASVPTMNPNHFCDSLIGEQDNKDLLVNCARNHVRHNEAEKKYYKKMLRDYMTPDNFKLFEDEVQRAISEI